MGGTATKICPTYCFGEYTLYSIFTKQNVHIQPSPWPCAATGLYHVLPNNNSDEGFAQDALYLFKAIQPKTPVYSDIIRIFANRTPAQLLRIKSIYDQEYGSLVSLEQFLKDHSREDWAKALIWTIQDRFQADADTLHELLTRGKQDQLRSMLISRTNQQMLQSQQFYQHKFNKTVLADINENLAADYKQALTALQAKAEYLAQQLNASLKGVDSDDSTLIRILCSIPKSNGLLRRILSEHHDSLNLGWKQELEYELSMPDLQDIQTAYLQLFKRTLADDVSASTTNLYRRTLLTLLLPPQETAANAINQALEGKDTNERLLTEMMTCHSNRQLQDASQFYQKKFGRPLTDAILADCSGEYQKTLLALLQPRADILAQQVKLALDDQDEPQLLSLLIGKTRFEIHCAMQSYEKRWGKPLEDSLRKKESWERRYLIYILRQASEPYLWLPTHHIRRLRDV